MKISFCYIGKTNHTFVKDGVKQYESRLKHYTKFEIIELPDIKNAGKLTVNRLKEEEGKSFLSRCSAGDHVILLDEKGKDKNSVEFAKMIEEHMIHGVKRIIFVVGGAFGFSEAMYQRANMKLRLSSMTFSHQLIRLIFAEQLYRAFTIINNEPYHNN